VASLDRAPNTHCEGVAWCPSTGVDALLVTLHKAERDFSPGTRYRDYPLSTELFHWEPQSTTTLRSPTARRYIEGGSTVLLFVRSTVDGELGTAPYLCLGEADHVEHHGERPIAITWRLRRPMPPGVLQEGAVVS
jgi:hypothetical protein